MSLRPVVTTEHRSTRSSLSFPGPLVVCCNPIAFSCSAKIRCVFAYLCDRNIDCFLRVPSALDLVIAVMVLVVRTTPPFHRNHCLESCDVNTGVPALVVTRCSASCVSVISVRNRSPIARIAAFGRYGCVRSPEVALQSAFEAPETFEDPTHHDSLRNVVRREHSGLPLRAALSTEQRPEIRQAPPTNDTFSSPPHISTRSGPCAAISGTTIPKRASRMIPGTGAGPRASAALPAPRRHERSAAASRMDEAGRPTRPVDRRRF